MSTSEPPKSDDDSTKNKVTAKHITENSTLHSIKDRMQQPPFTTKQGYSSHQMSEPSRKTIFSRGHKSHVSKVSAIRTPCGSHSEEQLKQSIKDHLQYKFQGQGTVTSNILGAGSIMDITITIPQTAPLKVQITHGMDSTRTEFPRIAIYEILPIIIEAHLKQGLRELIPDAHTESELQYILKIILEHGIEVKTVGAHAAKVIEESGSDVKKYLAEMRDIVVGPGSKPYGL